MRSSITDSVIVTTVPFSEPDATPRELLADAGIALSVNPLGRRLQADEVAGAIGDHAVVIAGTEPITAAVMAACPNLRAICRVGIGLDSVDLTEARNRGIEVSYTPDAPSGAVAELTIGLMIDVVRGASEADRAIRGGTWQRTLGRRLGASIIGVVGVGRIGSRVIRHLLGGFPGVMILAHDLVRTEEFGDRVRWTDLTTILQECDIVSLHLPLTPLTIDLIGARELATMKPDSALINTARGGIVNEAALADALTRKTPARAAIDVFDVEPYSGPLTALPNIVLTCHMGSMTRDCRAQMEIEATKEAIRFLNGEPFASPAPEEEFAMAKSRKRTQ